MRCFKRALALWLGLFFYFLLPLDAQENSFPLDAELSGGIGTLWAEESGSVTYWQSGAGFNLFNSISFNFAFEKINSSLPWADFSIFGFMGQFCLNVPEGGVNIAAGTFKHQDVSFASGKSVFSNEGGKGRFLNVSIPVRREKLEITPYLLISDISWEDGSMYWFFGKPKIPSFNVLGINISLDQTDIYKHSLGLYRNALDLEILNNDDDMLFDSFLKNGILFYRFSMEKSVINLSAAIGWLYIRTLFEGSLTAANQPYFLFPFLFYNVDAFYNIQAGFARINFQHNLKIFRYSFNLSLIQVLNNNGDIDLHYKMKKLFGGEETTQTIDLDVSALGAAILSIEASFPDISLPGNLNLYLGLQKTFFIPWGYDNFLSSINIQIGDISDVKINTLIKTILLSGLSIKGIVRW